MASELHTPELVLPAQFFNAATCDEPEAKLRLAVLEDALECLTSKDIRKNQKAYAAYIEARNWIMSNDDTWLFSFVAICESLGLDPSYIRKGMIARLGQGKWKPNIGRRPRRNVKTGRPRKVK